MCESTLSKIGDMDRRLEMIYSGISRMRPPLLPLKKLSHMTGGRPLKARNLVISDRTRIEKRSLLTDGRIGGR